MVKAAELTGGEINPINVKTVQPKKTKENHTEILTKIFTYFQNGLNSSVARKPKEYLQSRNLWPLSGAEVEIGYNSGQFHHRGKLSEADQEACIKAGLLIPYNGSVPNANGTTYTAFAKDCVIFPLKNKQNEITSLYGRSIIDNKNARHYYTANRTGLYPGYPKPETTKLIFVVIDINVILSESFEKWLKTLEYAPSTVYASVRYVNDFFFYLKSSEITNLEAIQPQTLTNYHKYLQSRKNKRQNGSLSNNYITSNINAIKRFSRHLQETGKPFFEVEIKTRSDKETSKIILTQSEIKALYKACDNSILGIRDRAILSIYYGCGLRRSEGVSLNVSDVLLKEKRIHVRQGKGYKERYIPMTEAIKEDIENYIYVAREKIRSFKNTKPEALFLSMQANRLCGNAIIERVHKLAEASKLQKDIGIHTLRHSIATHLLQSGMTLEEVSQFLGHSSLESTQIYTHLANA